MATTKLTLSADKDVVKLARKLAKRDGTSISNMFAGYIRARARSREERVKAGPLLRKITGLIKGPSDFDERKTLEDALMKKYGIEK